MQEEQCHFELLIRSKSQLVICYDLSFGFERVFNSLQLRTAEKFRHSLWTSDCDISLMVFDELLDVILREALQDDLRKLLLLHSRP